MAAHGSLLSRSSRFPAGWCGLSTSADLPQMVLIPGEGAVQKLAAASADPAFGCRVMRGVRTLQSTVRIPAPARTASNEAVKFEPRSRIRNLLRHEVARCE